MGAISPLPFLCPATSIGFGRHLMVAVQRVGALLGGLSALSGSRWLQIAHGGLFLGDGTVTLGELSGATEAIAAACMVAEHGCVRLTEDFQVHFF